MVNNDNLEEGQIVLCTVDKILGTTVFVKIEGGGEGTITTSEISPGRIRNLRDYVVPGKKIVCKILRLKEGSVHLSLRRVKQSEKKELLEKIARERSFKAMLKTVLGNEKFVKFIEDIETNFGVLNFFEQVKEDFKILEKYFNKEESEKIINVLDSKKDRLKEINQKFFLSNKESNGIVIVKKILSDSCKDSKCNINYIAAGKYSLLISGEDFKEIKTEVNEVLGKIEKLARKDKCEFSLVK